MTSMEKLLQEKNCYLRDRVQDWKEAVHIACEPLIEQNYCTTAYEAAIYEITERLGPDSRQQPIRCQGHTDGCDRAQGAGEIQAGRI